MGIMTDSPPESPHETAFEPPSGPVEPVESLETPDLLMPEREPAQPPARAFEDLSLGEFLAHLLNNPRASWRALEYALSAGPVKLKPIPIPVSTLPVAGRPTAPGGLLVGGIGWLRSALMPTLPKLLAAISAVAVIGAILLGDISVRINREAFPLGGALMISAALVMFGLSMARIALPRLAPLPPSPAPTSTLRGVEGFLAVNGLRLAVAGGALVLSLGAWLLNGDNRFTAAGVVCWALSVAAWVIVFIGQPEAIGAWVARQARRFVRWFGRPHTVRLSWSVAAMLVILALGAWFRFSNLSAYPPEMTSDHVEKLLDAQRVAEGLTPVFFPNNGGREGFQMYYLAFLHRLTGLPISFDLLKIGTGLEGMVMIVLAWWLGRAVFGPEDRRLGNLTGVIMAAMVATSYWHTMLSRLGLRIVLTTLAVTVILIFLARAMRHNRRRDYLIAGLMLGASMYFYQAMRMFPLVVIAGVALAVIFRARTWAIARAYAINMVALVIVAGAVFVPLGRYWSQYPQSFWERTGGRFFGEDMIVIRDDQGRILEERPVTQEERMRAFEQNLGVFFDNVRQSVLMFNYAGDRAFITGEPNGTPQLDAVSGGFFLIGLAVVAARMIRRRDPVDWLLPAAILIMLLPTALSIAFTIEVPSATRASGALPAVYLIAALGMAVVVRAFAEQARTRAAQAALWGVVTIILLLGAMANADSYFVTAMRRYRESTFPYQQAGQIVRGFAESTGAPGNAFMIGWDMWWDYRALGVNAGYVDWPNGVWYDSLLARIRGQMEMNTDTQYEIAPDRQLMFVLHPRADEPLAVLQEGFPGGAVINVQAFNADNSFRLYVAPPLGCDWLRANLRLYPLACEVIQVPGLGDGR
jgi:hypothetical protein